MKTWREFDKSDDLQRVTLAAYNGGYRASRCFATKEDAHAAMRELQKFAAAVRRDEDAPADLREAVGEAGLGGVIWYLPVQESGSWTILGGRRPTKRPTIASIIGQLP